MGQLFVFRGFCPGTPLSTPLEIDILGVNAPDPPASQVVGSGDHMALTHWTIAKTFGFDGITFICPPCGYIFTESSQVIGLFGGRGRLATARRSLSAATVEDPGLWTMDSNNNFFDTATFFVLAGAAPAPSGFFTANRPWFLGIT